MKTNLLRFAAFLLVLGLILACASQPLRFKYEDGILPMELFYRQPAGSVDVLALGSSHAYYSVNPAVLWREGGIPAYVLGSANQPLWNTYHNLVETLKTQRPKLILLEAFATRVVAEHRPDAEVVKAVSGMKLSQNKLDNFCVSAPEDRFLDFLLEPVLYHARYKDLSKMDFLPHLGRSDRDENWKGFFVNAETQPFEAPDLSDAPDFVALPGKTEEYYRKILELAMERDIPALVMVAPYPGMDARHAGTFLQAAVIAEEYGADFLDFSQDGEVEFDYETDFFDTHHLNVQGSEKLNVYLAEYLLDNYGLSDHRGDTAYASRDKNAAMEARLRMNEQIRRTDDLAAYWALVGSQDQYAVLACGEGEPESGAYAGAYGYARLWENRKVTRQLALEAGGQFHAMLGSSDLAVYAAPQNPDGESGGAPRGRIILNREPCQKVAQGLNFLVYDLMMDVLVDAVGFDSANGNAAVR